MNDWIGAVLVLGCSLFYNWSPLMRPDMLFGVTVSPDFRARAEARSIVHSYRVLLWAATAMAILLVFAFPAMPGHRFGRGFFAAIFVEWIASAAIYGWGNRIVLRYARPAPSRRGTELLTRRDSPVDNFWIVAGPVALVLLALLFAMVYPAGGTVPIFSGFTAISARWNQLVEHGFLRAASAGFGALVSSLLVLILIRLRSRRGHVTTRTISIGMLLLAYLGAIGIAAGACITATGLAVGSSIARGMLAVMALIAVWLGSKGIKALRETPASELVELTDDFSWRWGMFYCNADDPALLVQKRSGPGLTVNFAHPAAWVLAAAFLASLLYVFAIGVWHA